LNNERKNLQEAMDAVTKYGSIASAAKELGIPRKTLSGRYNKALDKGFVSGAPMLSPDQEIGLDSKLKSISKEKRELQKKYDELLKIYDQAKNQNSVIEQFSKNINLIETEKIYIEKDSEKSESTAIILCSDLHYEEVVESDKIDGLNEYNTDISKKRFNKLFQNSLKLIEMCRSSSNIEKLVLWLGGDFLTGYIHDENIQNNSLSPIEACIDIYSMCISAIDFLVENGSFREIIIPTSVGNHARTVKKMPSTMITENSYEWLLYNFLSNHYSRSEVVKFKLSRGYFNWLDIYGYPIRFHHGHYVKYQGGISGLSLPLNKSIHMWNDAKPAYIDCIGHWHQRLSGKNHLVNGSIIGYNGYAQSIKAQFEKPQQTLFLMHNKYGRTVEMPIFVE
jgi:DNA-binding Lrp family transcriptional regulator